MLARPRVLRFWRQPAIASAWLGTRWEGVRWLGVLDRGTFLGVHYRGDGRLVARVGDTEWASREAPAVFDEFIRGPGDPPPAPSEVAGFLGGLFDFSCVDLDELDGEAMKETRDA